VQSIANGDNGTTFDVLDGSSASTSVTIVSSAGAAEPPSIGVAIDSIALVAGPDNQLYLLDDLGTVTNLTLSASGQTTASGSFFVGDGALQLAVSPDGSSLFVLKGTGNAMNVSVYDIATEQQVRLLPAPANAVGLVVSIDGTHIYVLVGSPTVGNIQVYPVGK
jgi:hypothetical protein